MLIIIPQGMPLLTNIQGIALQYIGLLSAVWNLPVQIRYRTRLCQK
jgi:hypothetical protein